jgi:hypothetical protein
MSDQTDISNRVNQVGFYTAALTAGLTLFTFIIAFLTPPLSGVYCTESCFEYPYTDIASRFPRDYWWMFPAMMLTVLFVVLMVVIHQYASRENKVFSQTGLAFALIAAAVLLIVYFVQVTVIQPSLENGETEGIAILTQYNPHGIFIALEELGYLLMSLSFLCMAPVFAGKDLLDRAVRWLFAASFLVMVIALAVIIASYGINREYRFEVAAISIDWIVLIVGGILLSRIFRRAASASNRAI